MTKMSQRKRNQSRVVVLKTDVSECIQKTSIFDSTSNKLVFN